MLPHGLIENRLDKKLGLDTTTCSRKNMNYALTFENFNCITF